MSDVTESGGLDPGLMATLQHAEAVSRRRQRLEQAQLEAEEQLLHRAAIQYAAGQLDLDGVHRLHLWFKEFGMPRRSSRWNAAFGAVQWNRVEGLLRWRPNGPEGTWIGANPLAGSECAPPPGTAVVYVLFDEANEPCYVGSTGDLRARLKAHATDGKQFARWQAYGCESREAAFELEDRLLAERFPRLNRRRGR
jgi:hypothetical protein